ncbi:hypothetical protein DPMN_177663 [Dreissena polymorpha]|uniref:Uncharacterized protein n=1 Tax=Dreissena polymorpha TaxID=45954 RepID=A0A9D4EAQ0_DREPO|nr:hypothetical protein DPMN_177663 [Dreissena polymorpha]
MLAEEQAGFKVWRYLFLNSIDYKKAFDRVRHDGKRHVMSDLNIDEGLVQVI